MILIKSLWNVDLFGEILIILLAASVTLDQQSHDD